MLKKKFSRNLNYQQVFLNLIDELINFSNRRKEKINQQNRLLFDVAKFNSEIRSENFDWKFNELNNVKSVLGVSGGMDSSIVDFFASLAFGGENLYVISLPTIYNSEKTRRLAMKLPKLLKNNFEERAIELEEDDGENGQALKRALKLQKTKYRLERDEKNSCILLLNTSNLSEIKLGNFTINGDAIGDFGLLKTLYKSEIYQLVDWIVGDDGCEYLSRNYKKIDNFDEILNCLAEVSKIIPSAELRENQSDSNVLLFGDFYYKIADMILIAKDNNISDEEIVDGLQNEDDFVVWAGEFYNDVAIKKVAKYAVEKINARILLGENKLGG